MPGGLAVPQGFVLHVEDVLLANALLGRQEVCEKVLSSHRVALATHPQRQEKWSRVDEQLAALDQLAATVTAANSRELIAERVDAGRALLNMRPLSERPAIFSGRPPVSPTPE